MRYFTITRIQKWCEDNNTSRLLEALNSTDAEIRKASVLCLGAMGDAVALESLIYILENDPDTFVRIDAEKAITNIRKIGIDSRINMEPDKIQIEYNLNIS